MAHIKVLSVKIACTSGLIKDLRIDSPQPEYQSASHVIAVSGWVVSARPIQITLHSRGRQIGTMRTVDCPDALELLGAAHDPARSTHVGLRFEGEAGVAGLCGHSALQIRARLDEATDIPLARIALDVSGPAWDGDPPRMTPLLVTSLARSGTTWAMRILGTHPQLVAFREYPYEVRVAQYWAHMFAVLTSPANHGESAPTDLFYGSPRWVGHNPFFSTRAADLFSWLDGHYANDFAKFTRAQISGVYQHAAQRQDKAATGYFIEKADVANPYRHVLRFLFPHTREIYLIRDPRDMLCSILAFNRQRGEQSFGMVPSESIRQYTRRLGSMIATLTSELHTYRDQSYLVRYEDMVRDPVSCLRSMLEYLQVDSDARVVTSMLRDAAGDTDLLQRHRTSSSPHQSVGRWKKDLAPDLRELCEEQCREFLTAFGYR